MDDWLIQISGYRKDEITANGNRFLCGNGYMGVRGTMEEYGHEYFPAINLAGVYDKVGEGWREPVNAPNPFYTRVSIDGEYWGLPEKTPKAHQQQIDYRHGLMCRTTTFHSPQGTVTITSERFVHMERKHLLCMRYEVITDFPAGVEILTGIDGNVWDINGPHLEELQSSVCGPLITLSAVTHEKRQKVRVAEKLLTNTFFQQDCRQEQTGIFRRLQFQTDAHRPAAIEKICAVFTSLDDVAPSKRAEEALCEVSEIGYPALKEEHINAWEHLWTTSQVTIKGDKEAEQALNYSLYHLLSIAPFHAASQSIPARGLSGQTYKGAVFWDTEMFMLDFFLNCHPEVARTLLRYRIDTLPGAQEKAAGYGYEGAFYAWESQEGGFDACSDYNVTDVFSGRPMRTYFKDKQIHISTAVVYGIMKYVRMTGDTGLLYEGGAKTILECARFYDSLLVQKAHTNVYELRDVIGPDEYHERVNNNGYTNRMAQYTFTQAHELLKKCRSDRKLAEALAGYDKAFWMKRFGEDAGRIYIPKPAEDGVIEQFDGYRQLEDTSVDTVRGRVLNPKEYWGGAYGVASETQVIKQADVVAWMVMFPEDFSNDVKWKNWCYYEPRTEHGSSLSACMYSILACTCGHQEEAYPFFLKSAQADIKGGGKEWAGEVYIGGTHPAAAGGAYMTAIYGFGGLTVADGTIHAEPRLPASWERLIFRVSCNGKLFEVSETKDQADIRLISPASGEII